MNRSHAARRDTLLKEGWHEKLPRPMQARRALPIKPRHHGPVVAEGAVQERKPLPLLVAILATLSRGLRQFVPILGLPSFASLAYAQSEPAQATQGLGEVIVDTLLWIGTVVIVSSIGMVVVGLVILGIEVFLTLISGGPNAVREIWRKRERD